VEAGIFKRMFKIKKTHHARRRAKENGRATFNQLTKSQHEVLG
jgi:hypothetical protein